MVSSAPESASGKPDRDLVGEGITSGRLLCGFIFTVSLIIYWLTAEPTASWWDCPEYLTSAILLEIGHPPGNPFWMLTHRFIASMAADPLVQVRLINLASGLFMAGASALLCSISLTLLRKLRSSAKGDWKNLLCAGAGALCFSFSDSAWFSAVEAEVYAMSAFLTALSVWLALHMAFSRDRGERRRLIVFIAYLTGLSIGVHQLNLLVLPVIFLIWFFSRKTHSPSGGPLAGAAKQRPNISGAVLAFLAGILSVAAILLGLMPGWLTMAGYVELLFVNTLGLPYNSGLIAASLFSLLLCWGLPFLVPTRKGRLRTILWCVPMLLTGYFSYGVIIIRAAANPPMNQGDPSDPFRLKSYMLREQYGAAPLLYGATPYSKPLMRESRDSAGWSYSEPVRIAEKEQWNRISANGRLSMRSGLLSKAEYLTADSLRRHSKRGYLMTGRSYHLMTTPELDMFLTRIHSPEALEEYALWTGADTTTMTRLQVSDALDSLGNPVGRRDSEGIRHRPYSWRPTYLQNLKMLLGYQFGYMYGRYLLWNFSGRQNDLSSTGEIEHGNFLTGLPVLDNAMLGPQELLPPELGVDNKGRNRYFLIPFLFGLAGIVFLCLHGRGRGRVFWCSFLLFLMTGLAIVFYLNQTPGEPRERDYSFIGSFWVFAFWIAVGMRWMLSPSRRRLTVTLMVTLIAGTPLRMLMQNYDDHDRRGRRAVHDHALTTLRSLPYRTILFVNGDNDTFPFWYASHVLGIRRDVTVVNLSYLTTPWYIASLRRDAWEGKGLEMTMPPGLADYGALVLTGIPVSRADTAPAVQTLRQLYADTTAIPRLAARCLALPGTNSVLDLSQENTGMERPYLSLRQLALVDILTTNAASETPRPVVWHSSAGWKDYCGFYPLTRKILFGRLYDPEGRMAESSADTLALRALTLATGIDTLWKNPGEDPLRRYVDEITANKLRKLRREMMLAARVLADSGRNEEALLLTRILLERIPPERLPLRDLRTTDSLLCEPRVIAMLLRQAADGKESGQGVLLLTEALDILHQDSLNRKAYHRFRHALTPEQRHALTPFSRSR